jgi:hypothetical protein
MNLFPKVNLEGDRSYPIFYLRQKTGSCHGRAHNPLAQDPPTRHHELRVLWARPRHPGASLRQTLYFYCISSFFREFYKL